MAKFFRRGKSKIRFCPTVAGASPTRAELTAGTDLTPLVSDISGFSLSNSPIAVANLQDTFTPQIDGEDTTDDSTLTFNDDDAVTTVRTALAKGTSGFIVLMPYGDVAPKRCEVWPVRSTGVNDQWTTGNEAARFVTGFAITDPPKQSAVIPT